MKPKFIFRSILPLILFLALAPAASASSTWYVDGVNGNDSNDCLSSQTACKTIGHAISLCSSGDSVMIAPAIYYENLTIGISLKIIGTDAATTIVDGNQAGSVITISSTTADVRLSKLTIRNGSGGSGDVCGYGNLCGGAIYNSATLTVNKSTLSGNSAVGFWGFGGGIFNNGTLTINNSTLSGNRADYGGSIFNEGYALVNNSTANGNNGNNAGGGIYQYDNGTLTINNSTINRNHGGGGGGIFNEGYALVNNSTLSGNAAGSYGGGIYGASGTTTLQNSIVAKNTAKYWKNCFMGVASNGYNLSSDDTCNFNGPGDMNNTDPMLGKFGKYGGPTKTIPLLPGSPAINAGNPSGCTNSKGKLLKTDQRGYPRPDKQSGRCDIGAFERQHD